MRRRSFITGLASITVAAAARGAPAEAGLTVIVPAEPGGESGTAARILQPYLERALSRPVILDFRPGAGGIVGLTAGSQAAPDGATLTLLTPAVTLAPWLNQRMDCSPADFAPLGQVSFTPSVLVVRSGGPDNALPGLLARGATPDALAVPASSDWSPPQVAQALLLARAGLRAREMAGLRTEADCLAALDGGDIDLAFVSLDAALDPTIASWTRALAISAPARVARMPGVPSLREQGFDIAIGAWRALAVPADTPPALVGRYSAVLRTVMADPSLGEELTEAGLSPHWLGPAETGRVLLGEYRAAGALFAALGLTVRKEMLGLRTN